VEVEAGEARDRTALYRGPARAAPGKVSLPGATWGRLGIPRDTGLLRPTTDVRFGPTWRPDTRYSYRPVRSGGLVQVKVNSASPASRAGRRQATMDTCHHVS
jgi:hypothetical protein